MTYPVDDAGNVRVDFVWGHMPIQPDQGRERTDGEGSNLEVNGDWLVTKERGSSNLESSWGVLEFGTGDGDNFREQVYTPGYNDIATTGYSNYPAYEPNYAGDGDTGLETFVTMPDLAGLTTSAANALIGPLGFPSNVMVVNTTRNGATTVNDGKIESQSPLAGVRTKNDVNVNVQTYNAPEVPNVVGLTETAAGIALNTAGLVKGTVTTSDNAGGATLLNNGLIKSATPAVGTTVNTGSSVALVKYLYTATTTGPIATITNPLGEGLTEATEAWMYLLGRTVKPTVGDFINVDGNGGTQYNNNNFEVISVVNDDAFNTGGTKVKIRSVTGDLAAAGVLGNGGTWTKL